MATDVGSEPLNSVSIPEMPTRTPTIYS